MGHIKEEDEKIHNMAKKKIELETNRLEETERLIEDTNVALNVGEDSVGLMEMMSALDLEIYNDNELFS